MRRQSTRIATAIAIGLFSYARLVMAGVAWNASCYTPNGIKASGNYPCFPGNTQSACCGVGSICLSTGLCETISYSGVTEVVSIIRGSCTDSTWASDLCPQYCLSASTGGTNLISCSNVTNNANSFCCDHTNDCCDSGDGRFNVTGESTAAAVLTIATTSPAAISTTSSSTSRSIAFGATTSTSSVSPASSSASSSVTPVVITKQGLSTGAKAGVGIGAALGVLAILALTFLFYRGKKHSHPPGSDHLLAEVQKREEYSDSPPLKGDAVGHVAELHDRETSELHGTQILELHDRALPREMAGYRDAAELAGSGVVKE